MINRPPKKVFSLFYSLLLLFPWNEAKGAKPVEACLTGKIGRERIDENCLCRKNNSCTKVTLPRPKSLPKGFPSFVPSVTRNLARTARAVFNGEVSLDADLTQQVYGKHVKKIDRLEKTTDRRIAKKKGGAYLNRLKRDAKRKLDQSVAQGFKRMSVAQRNRFLSAVGAGFQGQPRTRAGGISAKTLKNVAAKGIKVAGLSALQATVDPRTGAGPAPAVGHKNNPEGVGQIVLDQDIVRDTGASIWKVLSGRYIKSAYPNLFSP